MSDTGTILVGRSTGPNPKPEVLTLKLANRHGLVAGATGTGKTVTLQVLAEGFSNAGVPVFAADIKGDLSGLAAAGEAKPPFVKRAEELGIAYEPDRFPTVFWDLFGEQGHPIHCTITEMGPLLLARLLELNDTQEGVLNIAFRVADENQWPLIDLKDLRALLTFLSENAKALSATYGNVASSSIGAIQRALLVLENQGADKFLGEPALNLSDFMRTDREGRGFVNILAADKLMQRPRLYASFLLWMLSELFEQLPEVGDLDKPKLVFFFDEAHLLFNDAPKALLDAVEQVVRLIRSKGVGVYFVTQNPLDVPETVLGQLGNRVQHALRAFTPPRPARRARRRRDLSPESRLRCRQSHHRTRRRRGAGELSRGQGHALHRRAGADRPTAGEGGAADAAGARQRHPGEPVSRKVRRGGRQRERLRDAGQAQGSRQRPGGSRRADGRGLKRHAGRLARLRAGRR